MKNFRNHGEGLNKTIKKKKELGKKLQGSPALWKQNMKKLGAVQDFCTVV